MVDGMRYWLRADIRATCALCVSRADLAIIIVISHIVKRRVLSPTRAAVSCIRKKDNPLHEHSKAFSCPPAFGFTLCTYVYFTYARTNHRYTSDAYS